MSEALIAPKCFVSSATGILNGKLIVYFDASDLAVTSPNEFMYQIPFIKVE